MSSGRVQRERKVPTTPPPPCEDKEKCAPIPDGGITIIEKDGHVQTIVPETKWRCYWRSKKVEVTPVVKKPVKKALVKKKVVKKQQKVSQAPKPVKKPVKKVVSRPKVQPAHTQEMEYICEPEK